MIGPGGSRVPVAVSGGLAFRAVSARELRSCGTTIDGRAYCWGLTSFGELGIGTQYDPVATPRAVLMPAAAESPALGPDDHACALTANGRIFCWGGYNFFGELGSGHVGGVGAGANVTTVPVPVVSPAP
jgi:alpha-tubulin suppressor-like RCC1 family protein